ncbi:MAG TPA: 3-dehydro-L-gulonate 2-dehydrogenase [Pirellula sp.]|nr:3-dehydro-L-gulonate 2-dehydrogenase [Pirellula sp.]
MSDIETIRIPHQQLVDRFTTILIRKDMNADDAHACAGVFAGNSLDGVHSHGYNRFFRFLEYLEKGFVKGSARANRRKVLGSVEQWDGEQGPGPLNAILCTDRAVELARQHGISCVALANTNHWLRGGTYGWRAADKGVVLIAWSNTIANMPPWGGQSQKLGNNPLVIAVPRKSGHVVLDMAMSQYSYGALQMHKMAGRQLEVDGGFDAEGKVTKDPEQILRSGRVVPIGFWKGSALSLLLDILAVAFSAGLSTSQITNQGAEYNLSQVFIAIDLDAFSHTGPIQHALDQILEDYSSAIPIDRSISIRYPGENVLKARFDNTRLGIPLPKSFWEELQRM